MCAKVGPEAISPRARIDAYFFFAETCARSATSHRQKSVPSTFTFFPIDFFFEKNIYICLPRHERGAPRCISAPPWPAAPPGALLALRGGRDRSPMCMHAHSITHSHTHTHTHTSHSLSLMYERSIYLSIYLSVTYLSVYLSMCVCVCLCVCVHTHVCVRVWMRAHTTQTHKHTQTHTCSMYLLKVRRIVLDGPRPICPQFGPATNTSTVGYCCSR
jgi:hypothetical protein